MTNISIVLVLMMLFLHWLADFVCQTDWEAQNKSKSNLPLLSHTFKYSILWFPFMLTVIGMDAAIYFTIITFISHTITDYITSRVNTNYWNNKKVHQFFVSIGFDQWLHFLQLFLTYMILR